MEFLFIIFICIVSLIILSFVYNVNFKNIKKLKSLGYSEELNKITNEFPENIDACRSILKKLRNADSVNIEESVDENSKSSFYIVATNKIIIANIKNSFTRIQTIAHECIHSVQDKKLLWFNFLYSNVYLIYFAVILILTIFNKISNPLFHVVIFTILSFVYYKVKSYIETDAMTRAPFIAKEYMEDTKLVEEEKIKYIMENYETINNIGIKLVNYSMYSKIILKVIIYCIICFIKTLI